MRKRRAIKRDVLPDPIYNSKVVTKLINAVMNDGKKGTATRIVNEAFDKIKEQTNKDPMEVFTKAMENITPALEEGLIERLYPNQPKHPKQQYRLTKMAKEWLTGKVK